MTRAIEPPPAPIVWMSIIGTWRGHAPMRPSVVTSALAAPDQADVGAGAADVDRDHVGEARGGADQARPDHAGGGAGQRGVDALLARDRRADHAAVRLHDPERRRDPALPEPPLEPLDVAADQRLHVGVERGRHRALVLAEDGEDLAGQRHRRAGVLRAQELARAALVGRVRVGVEEADRDRVDARGPERRAAARTAPSSSGASSWPSTDIRSGISKISSGGTGRAGFTHANMLAWRGMSWRPISST